MLVKMLETVKQMFGTDSSFVVHVDGFVSRVIDGDTIKLLVNNKKVYTIRLYGIDTPEKKQSYYEEAKAALEKLILNKDVVVKFKKRGVFGRIIGKIYRNAIYINLEMVATGNAWHYAKYTNDDPILQHAQEMAQAGELGLWSLKGQIAPWKWRKAKKHAKITSYWLNTDSNTRHNNRCKFYNNSITGRACDSKEGKACQICGG